MEKKRKKKDFFLGYIPLPTLFQTTLTKSQIFPFLLSVRTSGRPNEKVFLAVNKVVKLVSGNQC